LASGVSPRESRSRVPPPERFLHAAATAAQSRTSTLSSHRKEVSIMYSSIVAPIANVAPATSHLPFELGSSALMLGIALVAACAAVRAARALARPWSRVARAPRIGHGRRPVGPRLARQGA
jgi:hypothetical protein